MPPPAPSKPGGSPHPSGPPASRVASASEEKPPGRGPVGRSAGDAGSGLRRRFRLPRSRASQPRGLSSVLRSHPGKLTGREGRPRGPHPTSCPTASPAPRPSRAKTPETPRRPGRREERFPPGREVWAARGSGPLSSPGPGSPRERGPRGSPWPAAPRGGLAPLSSAVRYVNKTSKVVLQRRQKKKELRRAGGGGAGGESPDSPSPPPRGRPPAGKQRAKGNEIPSQRGRPRRMG